MSVLQALHDSEINASVSSFFDNQWRWRLGDEMNGFIAEGDAGSERDALDQLEAEAIVRYPDSDFAKACAERLKAAGPETI